jgi:CHAD domain-containing protein
VIRTLESWYLALELPLDAELRRLTDQCCEQIATWAEADAPVSVRVHRVRRSAKRLRALGRLVRVAIGREQYKHWNSTVRDLGRLLSDARDADVLEQTWSTIRSENPRGRLPRSVDASLDRGAKSETGRLTRLHLLRLVARRIREASARFSAAIPQKPTIAQLRSAVAAAHRRTKKQIEAAKRAGTNEELHELRKRAKVVLSLMDLFVARRRSVRLSKMRKQLGKLSDALGELHDRAVLEDHLEQRFPQAARAVERLSKNRAAERTRAIALAQRIFSDEPEDFAKRLVRSA